MQVSKHTFIILQCVGLWRPVHWTPGWKTFCYNVYSGIFMFILVTVSLSELIALLSAFDDAEAFAANSFMLLTMIAVCGKATSFLAKRSEIIELINRLRKDPCTPITEDELAIQSEFDEIIRSTTLGYAAVGVFTVFAILVSSVLQDVPQRALPYKSWLPFECYQSLLGYSIAYIHQIVSIMGGSAVNIAFDTLVTGLMLQTCAQLNILKHRFNKISYVVNNKDREVCDGNKLIVCDPRLESTLVCQCIGHHIAIFEFAETSNTVFAVMLFVQYAISTIVICSNVLMLSRMEWCRPEFATLFTYNVCIITQIFVYCFFGCQVTFQSLAIGDSVYASDWSKLSLNAQRSLLMVMVRTLRPIKFTSGHFVTLNLEYFTNLLKLSYSAFSVLQNSS